MLRTHCRVGVRAHWSLWQALVYCLVLCNVEVGYVLWTVYNCEDEDRMVWIVCDRVAMGHLNRMSVSVVTEVV